MEEDTGNNRGAAPPGGIEAMAAFLKKKRKEQIQDDEVMIIQHVTTVGTFMELAFEDDNQEKRVVEHRHFPRARRLKFCHAEALHCINRDYLGPVPLFPDRQFDEMFRISRSRFQRLLEDVGNSGLPFYNLKSNAIGDEVPTLEARLLLPLKTMAHGVPPKTFRDYFQMSKTMARTCCNNFDTTIKFLYEKEYLRVPTKADLKSITKLHKAVHGIDGMFGSLDCMHTFWKNCPYSWQGAFQGKEGSPSIVLEALSDYHMWFWHAAHGYAGTLNDLTILSYSTLLEQILDGSFNQLEANCVPYQVSKEQFEYLYILVDGIYPQYSRFVKGNKNPVTQREKRFSEWQEACRKDIERAFGNLQGKFQCMARPFHQMNLPLIGTKAACALILHNMCISDRVMDGDVRATHKPDNTVEIDDSVISYPADAAAAGGTVRNKDKSTIGGEYGNKYLTNLVARKERWEQLDNPVEFVRLTTAIMDVTEKMKNPKLDKFITT